MSGCALSGGLGTTDQKVLQDLHCAGWRPIIASKKDVLTQGTEDQIFSHDEYGERSGCWSAPK